MQATLAEILACDNTNEQEAASRELVLSLSANTVNGSTGPYHFYKNAPTHSSTNKAPIIDSGASFTFTRDTTLLSNPQTHKNTANTASGEQYYTEERGKYKVTNNKTPLYITALSPPAFTQDIISVSQTVSTHPGCSLHKKLLLLMGANHRAP